MAETEHTTGSAGSDTKTGSDAPQPPGGPQRTDQPGGSSSVSPEQLTEDLQEQNAETSLGQPSDGSGGE